MTKPLSPKDVEKAKAKHGPLPQIIEAANELIAQKWDGREAKVKLKELGVLARTKLNMKEDEEFKDGELDIESIFREAGWIVEFDRPIYYGGENFDAYFTFKKRRTRG